MDVETRLIASLQNETENKLDQWIISELQELSQKVEKDMKSYQIQEACRHFHDFMDMLTNWYIRRSRRRFWKSANDTDKINAYATLYEVLVTFCQILAPFCPFLTEKIWKNLKENQESIHLTNWPKLNQEKFNPELNEEMRIIRKIVSLGLSSRAKNKIKVRQPLNKIQVIANKKQQQKLEKYLTEIIDELNVKEVEFIEDWEKIAQRIAKPNARKIGPKFGKEVKEIIPAAKKGQFEILNNGNIKIADKWELLPDEVEIEFLGKQGFDVESEQGVVIALDTKLTENLKLEGLAREIVRQIQEMRKEADFNIADRIQVSLNFENDQNKRQKVLEKFEDFIKGEVLGNEITNNLNKAEIKKEVEIETLKITIALKR